MFRSRSRKLTNWFYDRRNRKLDLLYAIREVCAYLAELRAVVKDVFASDEEDAG